MKILHTVHRYFPDTGGSEEVVRQLSEFMSSKGHDVTVATSYSAERNTELMNGVRIAGFRCSGNLVEGIRGEGSAYVDFVRNGNFDIIMNYSAHIWTTDLLFPLLEDLPAKKVLVPLNYYPKSLPSYEGYFRQLPGFLRRYDRIVYLSEAGEDKMFGDAAGLTNGIVIPNGVDIGEFDRASKGSFREKYGIGRKLILLNVSNHSDLKNHAFFWNAARRFRGEEVAAVLIGNPFHTFPLKWASQCYPRCRWEGIWGNALVLEGVPRKEVVEAFVDADIFVFGSKAETFPLVMLESFAARTFFVTRDVGNVREFQHIASIIDTEDEAVERINEFRSEPESFRSRIEHAYRHVADNLSWSSVGARYELLYAELLKRGVVNG